MLTGEYDRQGLDRSSHLHLINVPHYEVLADGGKTEHSPQYHWKPELFCFEKVAFKCLQFPIYLFRGLKVCLLCVEGQKYKGMILLTLNNHC